ncbi:MAG: glycerol kinase [Cyclobacteriaceae bacterium]|nr:MAG: glycerol kinase [Cyclobacteriaceae bacterium]
MADQYIIAIDQGTTSCRALLVDVQGVIQASAHEEFNQIFPKPGWVEHDPVEIWDTQLKMIKKVLKQGSTKPEQIAAIGITNQRETAVIWEKSSGRPISNAIVWQDKRTSDICEDMKLNNMESHVRNTTGLVIDSYFSGTKVKWMLDNVEGARERARNGELLFGTIDSWLIWNMTNGKNHVTDYTNASRTMLFNIREMSWDTELLDYFEIPPAMLPEVQPSQSFFGEMHLDNYHIPINGVAGDQQAALFGQACFEPGMAKNTYGTGCFMLLHTGSVLSVSENGLLTTLACSDSEEPQYALEGSIFIAGAAVQWLRDGLKIIENAADSEDIAASVKDAFDVYVVPAFAGLGAPYWDMYARGAVFGLTRDTGREHIVKATLESLAYQTRDVLEAMEKDSGLSLKSLKVDGGAVENNYLMQFQSDILGVDVERPQVIETTAMGAAYLAGIEAGIWKRSDIEERRKIDRVFSTGMDETQKERLYAGWKKAVKRSAGWLESGSKDQE